MDMLKETLKSEHVEIISVQEGDMKDYAGFLNKYYRKMPKIEGYHIFLCYRSDMKETTMPMKIQECNLEDALSYETNAYKIRFDGRPKDITYAEAVKLRRDLIRNTDINTIPRVQGSICTSKSSCTRIIGQIFRENSRTLLAQSHPTKFFH